MKRYYSIVLVTILLAGTAFGQSPKRFLDWGDGAYAVGSVADVSTSLGKREAGLFRNSEGRFAAGPNVAFKGALWGGIKFLEHRYPQHRKAFLWSKVGAGVAFFCVGVLHNRGVKR